MTLDEIFAAMPEAAAEDAHEVLYIDPATRQIDVPDAELILGVEADGQTERKYFACPRYVGAGIDLAACFLRVNYRTANGDVDAYLVEDAAVNGEYVTFSWELSRKVTAYKGKVQFIVCAILPGSTGTYPEWNTTIASGTVLEGLEPDGAAAEAATADVIAQLLALVERQAAAVTAEGSTQIAAVQKAAQEATSAAQEAIEAKGAATLATIPADYTTMASKVNNLANAVKGTMAGEIVRADDVSPVEHYPAVKVRSKNRFYVAADHTSTLCGVTYTTAQNSAEILLDGTASEECAWACANTVTLPAGTYTVSINGLNVGAAAGTDRLYIRNGATGEVLINSVITGTARSFTLEAETEIRVYLVFKEGSTYEAATVAVQIELGDTATEYTPYVAPETVTVTRCGKNLAAYTGDTKTDTISGISVTRTNNSAEFIVDGTATAMSSAVATSTIMLPPGTYTISVSGLNTVSIDTDRCYVWNQPDGKVVANGIMDGKPKTFTVDKITPARVEFVFASGTTYENKAVKIQLEQGAVATEYEPYNGATGMPAADGTVGGLTSQAPIMTLLADKADVIVECEYNRDTSKVIQRLVAAIEALGGTV